MLLPTSSIGRKIIMAITGQFLVLFILFHISGNSSIFFHTLNAYAVFLHSLPVVVWGGRLVLFLAFVLHIWYGVVLSLENSAAKPKAHTIVKYRQATFAGRYQIWTGVVIAAFLMYHLLQFTAQITNPAIAAASHKDGFGRPDMIMMVVRSFQDIGVSGIYVVSLAALGLHLFHGMQSSIQTWGWTNDRTLPVIRQSGNAAAIALFFWYCAIPVSIVMGIFTG
ncbi:MAG TPA: succinate dehydrogenase cytochrome b subunit [Nitrospirota bacterium]|nr:succinate dehydrogenase cytochrome b subunit [Nitrospirota bacterium]